MISLSEIERLRAENELYAAEMSAAREAGFYSAQELFDAYQRLSAELAAIKGQEPVFIVFDGQPGPEAPRFVEVETAAGIGRSIAEWHEYPADLAMSQGLWRLGPLYALPVAPVADKDAERKVVDCWCEACDVAANRWRTRMSICPDCGDKRCPKAAHHDNACAAMANGE